MAEEHIPQTAGVGFEEMRKVNQYQKEYWSARDLQLLLDYNHWRSFGNAIRKAVTSCQQSGNDPEHHFARARKPITGGKGAYLSSRSKSSSEITGTPNSWAFVSLLPAFSPAMT